MTTRNIPVWISAPLIASAFGALWWLEQRHPLRQTIEGKPGRNARNLAVAALGAAALQLAERPVIAPLTALVERRDLGLLRRLRLPPWMEVTFAVVLLDYTLYLWHVLTHGVPCLWRFHLVHHVDLDLDASTALRFHFGELICSVPWRTAQVLALGITPASFSAWQRLLFLSVLFHHSNLRLPIRIERWLNRLIVTPRMHGIHHSMVSGEMNSNWSSGLTLWDRLHGTLKLNVPQEEITIGVPAYRRTEELTLMNILKLPFGEERPARLSAERVELSRAPGPVPVTHLLS